MKVQIKKSLGEKDVVEIHDSILATSIGLPGRSESRPLSAALHRIDDHIYYEDVTDIYVVAALYAIAIARGHTFNDGNKRTAMVSMVTFLILNGISVTASNTAIEDMMVDVAEKKVEKDELAAWLKKYSMINVDEPRICS